MGIVNDITKSHWEFWTTYECIDVVGSWKDDEEAVICRHLMTKQIFIIFFGRCDRWVIKPINKKWGMPPRRYFNRVDNKPIQLLRGMFTDITVEAGGNTCWRSSSSCHVSRGHTTWNFMDDSMKKATTYVSLLMLDMPFNGMNGEWFEFESAPDNEGFCDYTEITKIQPTPKGFNIYIASGVFCNVEFNNDVDPTYYDLHFEDFAPFFNRTNLEGKFIRYHFKSQKSEIMTTLESTLSFLDTFIKPTVTAPSWANEPLDALVALCGPLRGRRIFEFRDVHGEFEKVEDLYDVHGVGRKLVEKWTNEVR